MKNPISKLKVKLTFPIALITMLSLVLLVGIISIVVYNINTKNEASKSLEQKANEAFDNPSNSLVKTDDKTYVIFQNPIDMNPDGTYTYEVYNHTPTKEELAKLAKALNVDVSKIIVVGNEFLDKTEKLKTIDPTDYNQVPPPDNVGQ